jgi:hypothetical protein
MKKLLFLIVFLSAHFGFAQNNEMPYHNLRKGVKPKLLILGTFHFKDAGKDGYKPKFSVNILSEKRQKEVEDLVEQIAKFKPTKIGVEWKKEKDQAFLDSAYQVYLEGKFVLKEKIRRYDL